MRMTLKLTLKRWKKEDEEVDNIQVRFFFFRIMYLI